MQTNEHKPIHRHSGKKYLREIHASCPLPDGGGMTRVMVDVYAVLEAFDVRCPAVQHAVKKLLCAGLRDKGSRIQDINESIDALYRAVEMERDRQRTMTDGPPDEQDTPRIDQDV